MWWIMPDVVISKGGYASVPTVLAAVFYRIPIVLHESDSVAGVANRFLARFAGIIALGFAEARSTFKPHEKKAFVTGVPIRLELASAMSIAEARAVFQLPADGLVVLVLGGSQGAQQINELTLQVLSRVILDAGIIHSTGPDHFESVRSVATDVLAASERRDLYRPYPFLTDTLPAALKAADIVVCRAGATTLAELAYLRKTILIVPYPHSARDHQRRNAQVFEQQDAARVLDPQNSTPALFARNVYELLHSAQLREELAQNVSALAAPHAADKLAELAFKLAAGLRPV
jgi:UDP-N-acetylglucosamine--N-acetylmuramyl-(pentapeptide) pyrophosphoryl-undecaprenol N-acetylglucosamine transferase